MSSTGCKDGDDTVVVNREVEMKKTFDRYDLDQSGFIDCKELRKVVAESLAGENPSDEDIDAVTSSIMSSVDANNDGKISFDEFKQGFGVCD